MVQYKYLTSTDVRVLESLSSKMLTHEQIMKKGFSVCRQKSDMVSASINKLIEIGYLKLEFDDKEVYFKSVKTDLKLRKCLACGRTFKSDGNHNRICTSCKDSVIFDGSSL